jgi:hypothetical protein
LNARAGEYLFDIKPRFTADTSGITLNRSNKGEQQQDISALEHSSSDPENDSLVQREIKLFKEPHHACAVPAARGGVGPGTDL